MAINVASPCRKYILRVALVLPLLAGSLGCAEKAPVIVWGAKPIPDAAAWKQHRDAAASPAPQGEIRVLSGRADLVSGGDSLIEVVLPPGVAASDVRVDVDDRDVTSAFAVRPNGRYIGLVADLKTGPNILTAHFPGGGGQRITLTNHPRGGPIFAGPQVQPWICTTQDQGLGPAQDAACNAPTRISYLYQPRGAKPGHYEPYDPEHPPTDVATTTTDEGVTVPYIIRTELGTVDRSIYRLAVLADPSKPWKPWAPQQGWNGKLFVPFGGGCGTPHKQKPPSKWADEQSVLRPQFLSRGWMGATSGLNSLSQNCNEVVSAEAVMMLKEHIEKQYGAIRHTIGRGESGGSIQQNNIAAAYPGLLDGVSTDNTFPDLWTMSSDAIDCYLLTKYYLKNFGRLNKSAAAAIMGKSGISACVAWTVLFGDLGDPQNRGPFHLAALRFGCDLPSAETYDPVKHPQGVRCSVQDYQAAIWGQRGPHHAAPVPFDNVGVQYGLGPLNAGVITPAQFVDLNAKVGGLDEDWQFVPERMEMDATTATTLFRAGRLSDPRQLAKVPMLDVRNNANSGDIHQPYMTWVMRARLDAANSTHDNQVIWDHPGEEYRDDAVFAMDWWLMAVERDRSGLPLEQKIIRDRPAGLADSCWIEGKQTADQALCRKAHPYSDDARIAAGGPLSSDIRKCQLKPLQRSDYSVVFSDAEWAQLQATFPNGVCDWSKPSIGYQVSIPWMSYAHGPGGQPLGRAPRSENIQ